MKAWGLWLLAALVPFLLTKNPFYLLIAILIVGLDYAVLCPTSTTGRQWGMVLQLGLVLALFSVGFNVLFVNVGATRLLTLPMLSLTLGGALIQIGGAVTLESLVYGLAQALGLVGILVALATFNVLADHYELLRSAPRFLYQSAIVLSIAVTFVPQMMAAQAEIREAQALRGHRFRTLRDLPPLFIALLAEGLERSITLAESMSARGFGGHHGRAGRSGVALQAIIALGLFTLICGAFALAYLRASAIGALILAVGAGMLAAALWSVGQRVKRSRYRRGGWRTRDMVLAAGSLLAMAALLGLWALQPSTFIFYPYPRLEWPSIQLPVVAACLLLAIPAAAAVAREVPAHD